jgi:phosphoribosylformylglycinamidine synthase
MKFGIVKFPGSNSDEDAFLAVNDVLGSGSRMALAQRPRSPRRGRRDTAGWVQLRRLPARRCHRSVLSDHARSRRACRSWRPVIGICNGFQIACEAGCCRVRCFATRACSS